MDLKAHLADAVLPALVADGRLGRDVALLGQDIEPVGGYGETHWMSTTFRVAVNVRDQKTNATRTERLVAKFMKTDQVWCDPTVPPHNEEVIYGQVLPLFQSLWDDSAGPDEEGQPMGLFAKCYHINTSSEPPLMVLEDLCAKGFRMNQTWDFDRDHAFLAMRQLGKFHGLSYGAKIRRRDDFLAAARRLRECDFGEPSREFQSGLLGETTARGLRRLAERVAAAADGQGKDKKELLDVADASVMEHLRRRLQSGRDASAVFDIMAAARRAEEPLAVVAHGDFCRNNVMFKYDEDTGRPVDLVMFDTASAKYCSAAVDLSFFLFMTTAPSLRAEYWDDMFVAYYDGLSTVMRRLLRSGPNASPTMEIPSLSAVRADFARHALYGFSIASYFALQMQVNAPSKQEDDDDKVDHRAVQAGLDAADALAPTMADKFEAGRTVGRALSKFRGRAGDDAVAGMLLECVDRGLVGL